MAKILVSYPVLGRPNMRSLQSLYSAIHNCKDHEISIYSSENDSMISRVRNVHLSVFMNEYSDNSSVFRLMVDFFLKGSGFDDLNSKFFQYWE